MTCRLETAFNLRALQKEAQATNARVNQQKIGFDFDPSWGQIGMRFLKNTTEISSIQTRKQKLTWMKGVTLIFLAGIWKLAIV